MPVDGSQRWIVPIASELELLGAPKRSMSVPSGENEISSGGSSSEAYQENSTVPVFEAMIVVLRSSSETRRKRGRILGWNAVTPGNT